MGGINHQPCNKYLVLSTELSLSLSMSRIQFELANVYLEELILDELAEETSALRNRFQKVLTPLNESVESLHEMRKNVESLRNEMLTNNYADLPTVNSVNMVGVGFSLSDDGMVDLDNWNSVQTIMAERGFYGMLDVFDEYIEQLLDKTVSLKDVFARMSESGVLVNEVTEFNKTGNFKRIFAELYMTWAKFQTMFLASSLFSTEAWYAHTGNGTLAESKKTSLSAA